MKIAVQIELTEPMLGTIPKNEDVYRMWCEIKAPKEDEALPVFDENRSWTGFHTDVFGLHVYDYQIKGFVKEAASILPEALGFRKKAKTGEEQGGFLSGQTIKGRVDNQLFIFPRRVYFIPNKIKPDGYLERSIRVITPQGARVTLGRSDTVEAGTKMAFEIYVLDNSPITFEGLRTVMQYGELKGLGQWRNGSYGRFKIVEYEKVS